jgi:steroid 5-alpha reductase family enzyme
MLTVILLNVAVISGLLLALWGVSVLLDNVAIIDIFWGPGFAIIAWLSFAAGSSKNLLVPLLASVWGVRLGVYLWWRNRGKGEDRRYQAMRSRVGDDFWYTSLVYVFGFQACAMLLVSAPVQSVQLGESANAPLVLMAGLVFFGIGLFFESVGDAQLARFKATSSPGEVMDKGLWRYTRHPNYFGDFLVWWGIYFVAVAEGAHWWTVFGPGFMSFFLLRVTGVTVLERDQVARRPAYADYIRRTSTFVPWPPRKL